MRPWHTILISFAGAGLSLAIVACGGSSAKPTASTSPQFVLARCMRAHGVSSFPDPTVGAGGEGFSIEQTAGSSSLTVDGVPFSGPAFQTAEKVCGLFGGGSAPPPVSESQKLGMIANARCIREHGVPNFPDPTFPAGGGISSRGAGAGNSPQSPAVERAVKACVRVGQLIPGVGSG